jgi:hypothetical protein
MTAILNVSPIVVGSLASLLAGLATLVGALPTHGTAGLMVGLVAMMFLDVAFG